MTRINTNVPSLVAQNRLSRSNSDLQTSLTRLSTGMRINSGSDDPAGLIASEALRSEITSLNKAITNTQRASQIIATADSALGQVSNLLNDVRGLVVEAANSGALSDDEIEANQLQIDSSLEAINRISQTTTFQGRKLLDGSLDFLTKAGTNYSKIENLRIDQATLGSSGKLDVAVKISSAAERASVSVENIPVAIAAAKSTGTVDFTRTVTAVKAAGAIDFSRPVAATQASGSYTIATTATPAAFTVTAKAGGAYADAAGNAATFEVVQNAGQVGNVEVTKVGDDFTISIKTGATVSLDDVKTAFDLDADVNSDFDFTVDAGGTDAVDSVGMVSASAALAGGAAASTSTGSIALEATADGSAANGATITLTKTDGVTTPTATVDGSGNITITVEDTDAVTFADIKTAIDTEGTYAATIDSSGGLTDFDNDTDTTTLTNFSGGVDAVALSSTITLSALTTGVGANGATITFTKTDGVTTPTAAVDGSGNVTITVEDTDAVTVASILQAINDEGTYSATSDVTGGLTSFDGDTDVATPAAFAGGLAASGGLTKSAVFELQGRTGSEVFNVSAGTGIDDLIKQINLVKDATGVTAAADGTSLVLTSNEYGSAAYVDLRVISEDTSGTFTASIGAGARDTGADVVAKVNGVDANGKGNELSINTSTLDLTIEVEAGTDDAFDFQIIGGGALFQLGGDVVSNQQARVGISSMNSARLGGISGKLFQLGTGESASLSNDPNTAAKIVSEAINQVTSLRGRLGAFQATTLESNKVSLGDTVANLQEAESSIRDADFAAESARLTRAQILVQSGTNVLAMANQNPQSVLSLLR